MVEASPIMAKLRVTGNKIYFPAWIQDLAGIRNGQTYEVYLTEEEGVIILKRTIEGRVKNGSN